MLICTPYLGVLSCGLSAGKTWLTLVQGSEEMAME